MRAVRFGSTVAGVARSPLGAVHRTGWEDGKTIMISRRGFLASLLLCAKELKSQGLGAQVIPVKWRSQAKAVINRLNRVVGTGASADAPSQPGDRLQPAPLNYEVVTSVIGDREAERAFELYQKPPRYEQDLAVNCQCRREAHAWGIQGLEHDLTLLLKRDHNLPEAAGAKMQIQYELAQMFSYAGNMRDAISHFQTAYDMAVSAGAKYYELAFEKILGIAELRQGEVENWIRAHNAQSSIFPLRPDAEFKLKTSSENAVKHFLNYLAQRPLDMEERWLLALAYMTIGKYPDGVPNAYRLPLAAFASEEDIGRFVDVAPQCGLSAFGTAGGVIMDDFDNDGCLDIVISGMAPCEPLRFFRNNGDRTFTDRTSRAGLSGQLGGLNIIQTDYNNDGWLDIYVMRGGWSSPVRHSLLRNNGDGTFTDVTAEAGLAVPATASQTAAWADFDHDGHLDLFVGNENAPAQLFHNNGDGTFTDIAHAAGVNRTAYTKGVVAGDYDNDGYPDLYLSNYRGENFLYHNNGDGTFTDVARQLHVEKPLLSFPVWFFDYDNDGWLDLFVSSYIVSVSEVVRSYLNLPVTTETAKLYKNVGGSFRDATEEAGLDRVFMPMGANFGDVDNDGFLDIYLGTGSPSYASLVPNVLLRNHEGRRFVDITSSSCTGSLQKGHGVAVGNIFNDGKPAIFAKLGGMTPGDGYYCALYKHPGSGNNWIDIKLVGARTNRAAIGVRIKLTVRDVHGRRRTIYRHVTSGGSFGASPLEQHIGVGKADKIEEIEIGWPTSNTKQIFTNVRVNQSLHIREFDKNYTELPRRRDR